MSEFVLLNSIQSLRTLHMNLVDPNADDDGLDFACAFLQKQFNMKGALARCLFLVHGTSVSVELMCSIYIIINSELRYSRSG